MKLVLERGDVVGVAAPGFAVRRDALDAGVARLRSMGFEVDLGEHVLSEDGYLAGSDEDRASDVNAFLEDPRVRAIWFARGGYGTARLLDRLDWRALSRDPKLLLGYSDATALFAAALRRNGQICLYAPNVSELGDEEAYHAGSLLSSLSGKPVTMRFGDEQVLTPGRAAGRLAGGNLTVLVHLLGTRRAPRLQGAIVFLEDAGEETYRLDRLLNHLRMSRALDGVAGIVVGSFDPAPTRRSFPPDRAVRSVLADFLAPLEVPVVIGLPAGHLPGKWTIPLGGIAKLNTRAGTLEMVSRAPDRKTKVRRH